MRNILKFFGNFLSFLLSIIFCILSFTFIIAIISKQTINSDNLSNYFYESDIMNIKLSEIYSDSGEINDPESAVGFFLRDALTNEGMNKETTDILLKSDITKKIASDYIGNQITYSIGITDHYIVNYEDLVNKLTKSGITLKQNDKISLQNTINYLNEKSKGKIVDTNFPTYINDIIKTIYNNNFAYYFIGIIIIFYLLLSFFTWSLYKPLNKMGISIIISGALITILGCIQKFFIDSLKKIDLPYLEMILDLLKPMFTKILIYGISTIIIGSILLYIYKIIKRKKDKEYTTDLLLGNKLDDNIVVGATIPINNQSIESSIQNEINKDETTN